MYLMCGKRILALCSGMVLAVAAVTPLAAGAATANTAYVTLGYTATALDYTATGSGTVHPSAWSIRGGYYFTPHLAGEIHMMVHDNTDAGFEIESGVGAFVRGDVPIGSRFRFYALGGYAYLDRINPGVRKRTLGSFAYGLGAEFDLGRRTSLALDYIVYNDKQQNATFSTGNMRAVTAGVKVSF